MSRKIIISTLVRLYIENVAHYIERSAAGRSCRSCLKSA